MNSELVRLYCTRTVRSVPDDDKCIYISKPENAYSLSIAAMVPGHY